MNKKLIIFLMIGIFMLGIVSYGVYSYEIKPLVIDEKSIASFFSNLFAKKETTDNHIIEIQGKVCCEIKGVYPNAVPTYQITERDYCSNVMNGHRLMGASRIIVDISLCENNNFRICNISNKQIYDAFIYRDTGSMNFKDNIVVYYDKNKIPKVNDIVVINHTYYDNIINDTSMGIVHRVKFILFNKYYITKGDNIKHIDNYIFTKKDFYGVVVCEDE